ncbi:MAG: hypothetical protein AABX73_01315 [Nanoarchaeota archaeon]
MDIRKVKECFLSAKKSEIKGKKHKGLLIIKPNQLYAEEYVSKAKKNLEFCEFYKNQGVDYKLPEEWFYTLYYCGLAILCKFGVESRSQRCTAVFLRYLKQNKLIDYEDEFIERITVYSDKEKESDVDKREEARYSPYVKNKEVSEQYQVMTEVCKRAISQTEDIIYSNKEFKVPKELLEE